MKEVIANRRARKQLGKVASEKENNREDRYEKNFAKPNG